MSIAREPKQRKPKVTKAQTHAARRQADRRQRERLHNRTAELAARGLGQINHNTVYAILRRHHIPIQVYALKGRSDGIAYRRYAKRRPNRQWHIDLKQVILADRTKAYICVSIDDYSRYALAAIAGTSATTEWVSQVARDAIRRCGTPQELVSDNRREFVSVWEDSLTKFGQLLAENGSISAGRAPYPCVNRPGTSFWQMPC